MNIIPRRLIRQDLDLVDVFIEDTENEFIVVKDIPDVFSQGRNTFKIFDLKLFEVLILTSSISEAKSYAGLPRTAS